MRDFLVYMVGAVKTIGDNIDGPLIRFTDEENPDASKFKDFFTKDTDLGIEIPNKLPVFYGHGITDKHFQKSRLSRAELRYDEDELGAGVWAKTQLNLRDAYEKKIMDMADAGKMGWSSGSAPHLIVRESTKNGSNHILQWPLAEASLTPVPARPDNVVGIKSIGDFLKSLDLEDQEENKFMTREEVKNFVGEILGESFKQLVEMFENRPVQPHQLPDLTNFDSDVERLLQL